MGFWKPLNRQVIVVSLPRRETIPMIANRTKRVAWLLFASLVAVGLSYASSEEIEAPTGGKLDPPSAAQPIVAEPTVSKLTAEIRKEVLQNLETNLADR